MFIQILGNHPPLADLLFMFKLFEDRELLKFGKLLWVNNTRTN